MTELFIFLAGALVSWVFTTAYWMVRYIVPMRKTLIKHQLKDQIND